jgi:phosphohistidine swiveling domain-containing protein
MTKQGRPLYKKTFTRDFTLAIVEIWCRSESSSEKGWTEMKQPYQPFLIFEKTKRGVSCYIDERGIKWMKHELVQTAKRDLGFMSQLEESFGNAYRKIESDYFGKETLTLEELRQLLADLESFWTWFEAGWWLWESTEEELQGLSLPSSLVKLRTASQDLVPRSEALIRKSLASIFPNISQYIEVISGQDIIRGTIPEDAVLESRKEGYILVGNTLYIGTSRLEIEDAFNVTLESTIISPETTEVRGQPAFAGKVSGTARIVYGVKELENVRNGDIIISPMTMPDMLPALHRAAAFVTDEGGIMCHAAIIAREMKKPCVVGTKFATQVFKDGDMVEVDADTGIVRKIS